MLRSRSLTALSTPSGFMMGVDNNYVRALRAAQSFSALATPKPLAILRSCSSNS
jgi:hypothetical protein